MQPAIKVQNISRNFRILEKSNFIRRIFRPQYKLVSAVQDLNFEILAGEQVALLGPNGSGKTTTLKMLSGLLRPTNGQISILGRDPITDHDEICRVMATFFGTKSSMWPRLPVKDSFDYVRIVYDLDRNEFKKRCSELIETFELQDLLERLPSSLSLGQRMRCELVRRLLPSPTLILLDEPTIGMDVVSKNKFRDVIKRYAKQNNTTLLLTSHDTSDIEHLCERVIIIKEGHKLFDGSFTDLKANRSSISLESILVEMFTQGNQI